MNWTQRFGASLGLSVLFFLFFTGWLGLVPDTLSNSIAAAALLSAIGLYAVRVGALGIGCGLLTVLFALNADQATIGLGVPALSATLPSNYWLTGIMPTALVWFAFPILARIISRRLPAELAGLAIAAALLPLPAFRYAARPDLFIDTYLHPRPDTFAILPMAWPVLVLLVAALASLMVVLLEQPWAVLRPLAMTALLAATVLAPGTEALSTQWRLHSALDVRPESGGPLTAIILRAVLIPSAAPIVRWDGQAVTTGAFLEPLRPLPFGGATRADILPGLLTTKPGPHEVSMSAADDRRTGSFILRDAAVLHVEVEDGHIVVSGGGANAELDLLTLGSAASELLHRRFDGAGTWRSPIGLDQGDDAITVIAQSGDDWAVLQVEK